MLQFVRQIPVRIVIEKASSNRRGFLFSLSAGFSKGIDPLSGMSVNLVELDLWLGQLKVLLESQYHPSLEDVISASRDFLQEQAEHVGTEVQTLELAEERRWKVVSEKDLPSLQWTYQHYLEFFPKESFFDLITVAYTWSQGSGCEADFQHEGFKLLKQLQVSSLEDLVSFLQNHVGYKLSSGSVLKKVSVHGHGEDFQIIL